MRRRLVGFLALATVLGGCAGADDDAVSTTTTTTTKAATASESSSSSGRTTRTAPVKHLDDQLVADLEAVEAAHPGVHVSVALAPVGGGKRPVVVGDDVGLVAWSTIKVPLSLAVIDSGQSHPNDITAALTASDNAAAERLWTSLGTGAEASSAVEKVLRSGGDKASDVPSEVTSPGHSAFGQTIWTLPNQTAFTSKLPCLSGSSEVTTKMGQVSPDQRWGLGQVDGARFKGGWGQTPDGYVVRQLGLLPGEAKGDTAATLQVRAGSHAEGTAIADELAAVLEEHGADLPTGSCG